MGKKHSMMGWKIEEKKALAENYKQAGILG